MKNVILIIILLLIISCGKTETQKNQQTVENTEISSDKESSENIDISNSEENTENSNIVDDEEPKVIKLNDEELAKLNVLIGNGLWSSEIKELIVGGNINNEGYFGSPLVIAAKNGNVELVKFLLDAGVDLEIEGTLGESTTGTAFFFAKMNYVDTPYYKEEYAEIIDLLINAGAKDVVSETALMIVAKNGNLKEVKKLIENGTNVDDVNYSGYTPLILASQNGHLEVVKFLISKGADIDAGDNDFEQGFNSLMHASLAGHFEVVKFLVESGAQINENSWLIATPFSAACEGGNIDIVKFFIDKGADLNSTADYGHSPIYSAIYYGHADVVRLLLEKGVVYDGEINSWDFYDSTEKEKQKIIDIIKDYN